MTWTRVLGVLAIVGLTLFGYASWQNHKQALKRARDELELSQRWPKLVDLVGCTSADHSGETSVTVGDVSAKIPCAVRGRLSSIHADGTYAQIALSFSYDSVNGLSGRDASLEPRTATVTATSMDVRLTDVRAFPARRTNPSRQETVFARGSVSVVRVGPGRTEFEIWIERSDDLATPLVRVDCDAGPEDLTRLLTEPPETLLSRSTWLCGIGFSLTAGVQGGAQMTHSATFVHDLPASADAVIKRLRDYGFRKGN